MGEVCFVAYDSEKGVPSACVTGSPADVADFLSIWMKNQESGISLAQQLGVNFLSQPPTVGADDDLG